MKPKVLGLVVLTVFAVLLLLNFDTFSSRETRQAILPKIAPTPKPTVTVGTKEIEVELADDPESRAIGLSETKELSLEEGMLFVFDTQNKPQVFWMKNMSIPIEIMWIDDNQIVQIDHAVPEPRVRDEDLTRYLPTQPIDYVLEVAEGFSKQNNINVGTPVLLPAL